MAKRGMPLRRTALSTRAWLLLLAPYALAAAGTVAGFVTVAAEREGFGLSAALLLLSVLWLIGCGLVTYRWLLRPYRRVRRALRAFLEGKSVDALFALPSALTPEVPEVLSRLSDALNRQERLKTAMKQAEFLALQNQINPHFLYNTLEAIRGEALLSGMENIAGVTESLAVYFRYTISKVNQHVTLADELRNVESYFAIQKYRYGDRVSMEISGPEDREALLGCRMPKLTLQPIVENAITHGLEPKVSAGRVRIRFESTQSRLLLTISDNGVGMERTELGALQAKLSRASPDDVPSASGKSGGIALMNVNSRLRLLFGEQYGLTITSARGLGTDVSITLPLRFEGGVSL